MSLEKPTKESNMDLTNESYKSVKKMRWFNVLERTTSAFVRVDNYTEGGFFVAPAEPPRRLDFLDLRFRLLV
jgi:hypothetical protein